MDTLIKTHYDAVCERYSEDNVFFVFLYGSQNYGIDTQDSDVDTKAVILPRFEEFVLNKDALSTTHILSNNEHIDLKDIRLMFKNFWDIFKNH